MRADMGKVLVERPRWGSRSRGPRKGYDARVRRCLDAGETPTQFEGIKRRSGKTKSFNEHLGPLRRFLDSNVGRPWDKIYAEICQHVDRGNVVQKHILTHLFDYVATRTVMIDGEVCNGEGRQYGTPLRLSRFMSEWYVCPKSGLLRRIKKVRPQRKSRVNPRRVVLNKTQICLFLGGQWELVTVAPLPGPHAAYRLDIILKRGVGYWSNDHSE